MKNDKQKIYTRITIETQYPDDYGPTISSVEIPMWDATIDDMFTAFERVLIAHGYIGTAVEDYYKERAEEEKEWDDEDEVISHAPEDQEQVIVPLHESEDNG